MQCLFAGQPEWCWAKRLGDVLALVWRGLYNVAGGYRELQGIGTRKQCCGHCFDALHSSMHEPIDWHRRQMDV